MALFEVGDVGAKLTPTRDEKTICDPGRVDVVPSEADACANFPPIPAGTGEAAFHQLERQPGFCKSVRAASIGSMQFESRKVP